MKTLPMQWVKNLTVRVELAMFTLFLLATCSHEEKIENEKKAFVLSETMLESIKLDTVVNSQVKGKLMLNGKITADENRTFEIFPIVGGNVISIDAELGDYVKKNQVLGVIRSGEVAELDKQLIDAQSDLLVAQKNLSVKQDLFASKLASDRELVAAQKEVEKAEAGLRRVNETFSIYGFNKNSEYLLRSPVNGFVINKKINRDMTLPSGHNESVFTIAELSEVWAIANVYESDISRMQVGMDVNVSTLSYPGEYIKGKIDKIFNVLDPETKTMKVRIRINNPDFKLKPEMLASTQVLYDENKVLSSVPASAVIFDNSRQFVMIYKDRFNIETREVEVYKTTDNTAWLSAGVKPGEIVISKNQLFIYDALND